MYQRILLATDLTEKGNDTAHKAWELANQFDAKFYIIHVIEFIPTYGPLRVTETQGSEIDDAKKLLEKMGDKYMVPKENQFVVIGSTKTEILVKAKELEIDLIVVGSHGLHGISRFLGSTANAILHSAECDVVTVRS